MQKYRQFICNLHLFLCVDPKRFVLLRTSALSFRQSKRSYCLQQCSVTRECGNTFIVGNGLRPNRKWTGNETILSTTC